MSTKAGFPLITLDKPNPTTSMKKPKFSKRDHRRLEKAKEGKRSEIFIGEIWDED